ncbi:hypothetical protein [Mobiluncus porci]|uniref:Uncharacterized protein n=1 Tax=Mobiluncus porci TaxID=2652278 RepID=A0A7K0K0H3_9ACTO|nr:hypothetical protein [Mobiluncus porci]MST48908.1 hypothetical protein [Mobiluncus porci]
MSETSTEPPLKTDREYASEVLKSLSDELHELNLWVAGTAKRYGQKELAAAENLVSDVDYRVWRILQDFRLEDEAEN